MVRIRVKVGPKGQVVIPKVFREAYGIKEGGYIFLEPGEGELKLRSVEDPEETVRWIRERRKRIRGKEARLGDLAQVDLEEEFEE